MLRVAYAGHQHQSFIVVIAVDGQDLTDEFHPVRTDVVKPTDERGDAPGAGFCCEKRLSWRKAQCHIYLDALGSQSLGGLQSLRNQGHLHDNVLMDLRK